MDFDNGKKLNNMINEVISMIAQKGDKAANIMLLDEEFRNIMSEIFEENCFRKDNEEKKDLILKFYEEIVKLAKDLKNKIK